ncbi:MAG: cytochrome b [Pseudomonadota bacterium]
MSSTHDITTTRSASGLPSSLRATRSVSKTTYSTVAMAFHWIIAVAIVGLLVSGFWMVDAIKVPATQMQAFEVYQLHKSLGLTVLVLTVLRLGWRLYKPPPALPAHMGKWERLGASASHASFYILMIGMPLLGWAMVSASPFGLPTIVFGWFEWPHISYLTTVEDKAAVEGAFKVAHMVGGLIMVALLFLHIAAALKHHYVDRDDVMARMIPGLRPRRS